MTLKGRVLRVVRSAAAAVGDPENAGGHEIVGAPFNSTAQFICVMLTHVGRRDAEIIEASHRLLREVQHSLQDGLSVAGTVALQFRNAKQLVRALRLARNIDDLGKRAAIPVSIFILQSCLKVDSINLVHQYACADGCDSVLWIDDDVEVSRGAFTAMIAARAQGAECVGVNKRARPGTSPISRLLSFRRSKLGAPRYPHGCCMLLATDSDALPIPRRCTDDAWVMGRLIRPMGNRFERFTMLPSVTVSYSPTDRVATQWRRVTRMAIDSFNVAAQLDDERAWAFLHEGVLSHLKSPLGHSSPAKRFLSAGAFALWLVVLLRVRLAVARDRKLAWPAWS